MGKNIIKIFLMVFLIALLESCYNKPKLGEKTIIYRLCDISAEIKDVKLNLYVKEKVYFMGEFNVNVLLDDSVKISSDKLVIKFVPILRVFNYPCCDCYSPSNGFEYRPDTAYYYWDDSVTSVFMIANYYLANGIVRDTINNYLVAHIWQKDADANGYSYTIYNNCLIENCKIESLDYIRDFMFTFYKFPLDTTVLQSYELHINVKSGKKYVAKSNKVFVIPKN